MATVKIKFRVSSIETKAGTLYYQVIHNHLSRFKEVIVRLERSDMAYTADKVVELFSSPADCGGFVSFTW